MLPHEISELRACLAWSMSRLAKELGVDAELVVDWESGSRFPTKRHHERLLGLKETIEAEAHRAFLAGEEDDSGP